MNEFAAAFTDPEMMDAIKEFAKVEAELLPISEQLESEKALERAHQRMLKHQAGVFDALAGYRENAAERCPICTLPACDSNECVRVRLLALERRESEASAVKSIERIEQIVLEEIKKRNSQNFITGEVTGSLEYKLEQLRRDATSKQVQLVVLVIATVIFGVLSLVFRR